VNPLLKTLAALAKSQAGIFTSAEAVAAGVPSSTISRWVRAGVLEHIGSSYYRFAGQPDDWNQRVKVALGDTGPQSWLTAGSAARVHGFDGFNSFDSVIVLVPTGHRNRRSAGAIVRSTSTIRIIDRTTIDDTRVTSASRTIIELARDCTEAELEKAVDSAIRDGGTSVVFLSKQLAQLRVRGRAGVRAVEKVLRDSGGTNALERRFLRLVREARLPKPRCQVIHRSDGVTVARVDFQFTDTNIVVEVDGQIAHARPHQRQRDAQRRRELDHLGLRVLTFVHADVFDRPTDVVRDVVRAFSSPKIPRVGIFGEENESAVSAPRAGRGEAADTRRSAAGHPA
jgi:very-short-patch-repair endonuclease